jgi:hypothetical protein
MKRLRFHELLLSSESERTARPVPFKSLVTVIKGKNDRGKSCLIKSLYAALGAEPKLMHPKWVGLNVILHLYFSIDEKRYSILRNGRHYSLFDGGGALLGKFGSVTKGLGPKLAELFDFHLELTNANTKQPEQATPALLFLPYYFDQDASWNDNWHGFDRLKQFVQYRKAIAEFHTGLKPNEFYLAKSRKNVAEESRENLRGERGVVKRVLDKLEVLLKQDQFDINISSYQAEIDILLKKCNELRLREETIKEEMIALDIQQRSLERQIHITEAAASELGKDFTFAANKLDDDVECPICGAHYENSFAERFKIAEDEDQLRLALSKMQQALEECLGEIEEKRKVSSKLKKQLQEIADLLETHQGEVKLRDVLRSEGKKEVRVILRGELDDLNRDIGSADSDVEDAAKEMRQFTNKNRVKEIKDFYRERMSLYLQTLDVTGLDEENYKEVDCIIRESGSDKPRALLAFYFSILKTIEKYSTTTFCPIVIDSARQQEQDAGNWKKMIEFMRDMRPSNGQMVGGLVDDLDIDMGGEVIEMTDERQLLQSNQYEGVASRLRPYIDASLAD